MSRRQGATLILFRISLYIRTKRDHCLLDKTRVYDLIHSHAAVDLTNEQGGVAMSGGMMRLVGHDLYIDSTRQRCRARRKPRRRLRRVRRFQGGDHFCGSGKRQDVDVQSLLGEIALGVSHEKWRISRCVDDPHMHVSSAWMEPENAAQAMTAAK